MSLMAFALARNYSLSKRYRCLIMLLLGSFFAIGVIHFVSNAAAHSTSEQRAKMKRKRANLLHSQRASAKFKEVTACIRNAPYEIPKNVQLASAIKHIKRDGRVVIDEDFQRHYYDMLNFTAQFRNIPYHFYAPVNYSGPWIENKWIDAFCCERGLEEFGGMVPLFVQWVDLWILYKEKYYEKVLMPILAKLRNNTIYVTVSQNDQGIYEFIYAKDNRSGSIMPRLGSFWNVLVLSSGGFGHIPLPLIAADSQSGSLNCPIVVEDIWKKKYYASFVGTIRKGLRNSMQVILHKHRKKVPSIVYLGENWREIVGATSLNLAPRGIGRASFHMTELLQACKVPVYIWNDHEWLPYRNTRASYANIGYSVNIHDFESFILSNHSKIGDGAVLREKYALLFDVLDEFYTYAGVLKQIKRFLNVFAEEHFLACQRHPILQIEVPLLPSKQVY